MSSEKLPEVYLARHGNTAWTLTGQHTGLTDLPLTPDGEINARRLGARLKGMTFASVFTSPLQRAARTCELAGFGAVAETDPDLVEWDYGQYEGLRLDEILRKQPDWQLFRDGAPGGESPTQIGERADRVVKRVRGVPGDVLLFSSGHFIRVLTASWLALGLGSAGKYFLLSPASLSALSYEHNLSRPVIRLWNDDHHVVKWIGLFVRRRDVQLGSADAFARRIVVNRFHAVGHVLHNRIAPPLIPLCPRPILKLRKTPRKQFVPILGGHFAMLIHSDEFLREPVKRVRPLAVGN